MTEADVYIVFTTEPKEEQIAKLKDTCENLGLKVMVGAPPPRPR
jgi:hypothetical protein